MTAATGARVRQIDIARVNRQTDRQLQAAASARKHVLNAVYTPLTDGTVTILVHDRAGG